MPNELTVLQGLPEAQKKGTYHKPDSVSMTKKTVHGTLRYREDCL